MSNRQSRKKARVAVKSKSKSVPSPKKRKPVKKAKAKTVKPVQVGAPPLDMTPPEIRDTRPVPASGQDSSTAEPVQRPTEDRDAGSTPAPTPPKVKPTGPLVQGASCTWIGPLSATSTDMATELSLCPHCHGHVIAAADEETMRLGFEAWELGVYAGADLQHPPRPHPGYRGLIQWMRSQNKCWRTIELAAMAYREATGINVDAGL